MPAVRLSYFDFAGGRGEDCRIALHLAGVPFEDHRVRGPAWQAFKPETPWGGMPVLTLDGKGMIAHSNAILRFVGSQHGLHPSDPWEAALHDGVMDAVEDLRCVVNRTLGMDDEAKRASREAMAKDEIPAWFAHLEALIGDGPFLSGSTLCVADLKIFVVRRWFTAGVLDHIPTDVVAPFAKVTRLAEAVAAHPGVVSWYAR
ncbi:MAG: glutathione S-transferase family protein [Alphaproteobacteria bacterium]|nr:glutathione S-transferase family protein [Alphaproteobacteria bacterium]